MTAKHLLIGLASFLFAAAQGVAGERGSDFTGTVTVVHVNDIHTHIRENETAIGYAKIARFARDMKAQNPNTLFLDNGDTFSGTEYAQMDKAESLVPIFNAVGFDCMVTGNHDFSFGSQHLLKLAGMLDYPVLCANMVKKDTGKPIFPEYLIKVLPNGMRVAIIGITTPTSAAMGAADLKYIDGIAEANRLVAEVKDKADLIIGLCHVGDTPGDALTTMMMAQDVKGLNLIIDGHSHTRLPEGRWDNGILVAQTGEYCQNIGIVDLTFDKGKLVDSKARLISREEAEHLPEDPAVAKLVEDFNEKSDKHFAEVVGDTTVHLDGTRVNIRTGETNAGSFFADVMTKSAGAEIGMYKAGPIGGDIPPGPITRRDLTALARVNSMIIVKEVKGRDIVEFLNFSSKSFPKASGNFQQVSGLSYTLDPEAEGDKVVEVFVGGKPIEPDREYTVATIMGSDEEPGLVNGKFVREVEYSMELLYRYIKDHSPINPETKGRISVAKPVEAN